MKRLVKITLVFIASVILLLVVTNPGNTTFKNYLYAKNAAGYRDYDESGAIYGRLKNYFIFSIYTHKLDGGSPETYLGILGNFFRQW